MKLLAAASLLTTSASYSKMVVVAKRKEKSLLEASENIVKNKRGQRKNFSDLLLNNLF